MLINGVVCNALLRKVAFLYCPPTTRRMALYPSPIVKPTQVRQQGANNLLMAGSNLMAVGKLRRTLGCARSVYFVLGCGKENTFIRG